MKLIFTVYYYYKEVSLQCIFWFEISIRLYYVFIYNCILVVHRNHNLHDAQADHSIQGSFNSITLCFRDSFAEMF